MCLVSMACLFTVFGMMPAVVNTNVCNLQKIYSSYQDLKRNLDGTVNEIDSVSQIFATLSDNKNYTFKEAMA